MTAPDVDPQSRKTGIVRTRADLVRVFSEINEGLHQIDGVIDQLADRLAQMRALEAAIRTSMLTIHGRLAASRAVLEARTPPELTTLKQASAETGISYASIRELVLDGYLPAVRLGNSRRTLVRREDLNRLIEVSVEIRHDDLMSLEERIARQARKRILQTPSKYGRIKA
jgi:excisionase family DNA binding protein